MLRALVELIILFCLSVSVAYAETTEQMRDKAIQRFGKEWVTDIESWGSTLQEKMPSIKPYQPRKCGNSNRLDPFEAVDRFMDLNGKSNPEIIKPEVLVFVSTSMADRSLQQWARQADKIKATLVLRGFINNSLKETIKVTERIFGQQNVGGFSIDPEKFKEFNISKVPAVVVDYTQFVILKNVHLSSLMWYMAILVY